MSSAENVQALVNQTLRNRIMVTYALCAVAEGEVYAGELQRTLRTVKAIRRLLAEINVLICGPSERVSPSSIREAGELLAELENRTQAIEASLGPCRTRTITRCGIP